MYGRKALLLVRAKQLTSELQQPEFVLVWDAGREFVGSTPTAPFAKLALFMGSLDVPNGVKVSRMISSSSNHATNHISMSHHLLAWMGAVLNGSASCAHLCHGQCASCMQAFGFDSPVVQTALRRAQQAPEQETASHRVLLRPVAAPPGVPTCLLTCALGPVHHS